ncbi:MAG TPA: hypothetical protein VGR19_08740 [Allosphingosinicella sp.]|nr:hypothetical protein [Allosphingosinicella sp.]
MVFKGIMNATAAIALMATPAIASAQATPVAPAAETVSADSSLGSRMCDRDRDGIMEPCGGGFLIPLLALAAVILGILVLIDDDEGDRPISA